MTADRTSVEVALANRPYTIHIGPGLIEGAGTLLQEALSGRRCIIVSDTSVADHYAQPLQTALEQAGFHVEQILQEPGEQAKSFDGIERLINALLEKQPDRKTTLIALGGGVIGDLTGFAASILLRGVPFVQVPTTLLAQVDSSVGGKTGINTRHGKNLVGSFYQPRAVLADTDALKTLPKREMLAGYAEVVKYGLIDEPEFFAWLEKEGSRVVAGDPAALTQAIRTCCEAKARIVAADEKEEDKRALLNLGHTFGHALEAETGYGGALLHGEAVAIGMVLALKLSHQLGYCPEEEIERTVRMLKASGLPISPLDVRAGWDADALIRHMYQDKKAQGGTLTFILARGIGQSFVARDVAEAEVRKVLEAALSPSHQGVAAS